MYHSENTCAYDFHGPCCCLCAAGRKILRVWALRIAISSLDRCLTRWNFSIRFQRLPNHNGRHPIAISDENARSISSGRPRPEIPFF